MRRIQKMWDGLDSMCKLGLGCFAFYMMLYIVIGILEELLGVAM